MAQAMQHLLKCVCECLVHVYVCASVCVCLVPKERDQKRVLNPLELKLWTVVSCQVGTGNQTPVFYKNSKHS